jgi:hypothetical protein
LVFARPDQRFPAANPAWFSEQNKTSSDLAQEQGVVQVSKPSQLFLLKLLGIVDKDKDSICPTPSLLRQRLEERCDPRKLGDG